LTTPVPRRISTLARSQSFDNVVDVTDQFHPVFKVTVTPDGFVNINADNFTVNCR